MTMTIYSILYVGLNRVCVFFFGVLVDSELPKSSKFGQPCGNFRKVSNIGENCEVRMLLMVIVEYCRGCSEAGGGG